MSLSHAFTDSFQPFESTSPQINQQDDDDNDDDDDSLQISPQQFVLLDESNSPSSVPRSSNYTNAQHSRLDERTIQRRRRDVRAARDRLSDQYEQLRRVLPDPPHGIELSAKAQVLEYTLAVIQSLMKQATTLATELAIVTPEATRTWVRNIANDGRKPIHETVVSVMKLFCATYSWRYAEWWTLYEKEITESHQHLSMTSRTYQDIPSGVAEDPLNIHGCIVRDSISVMRLGWTLVHRSVDDSLSFNSHNFEEDEKLAKFARASKGYEFEPRIGMPGRVWTSRRAEWLIDLQDGETFVRSTLADEFGLRTCLAVPIQFGGHVHSVMAFYSRDSREYETECFDLACLLSQCLQDVYSPSTGEPWQLTPEPLFPSKQHSFV